MKSSILLPLNHHDSQTLHPCILKFCELMRVVQCNNLVRFLRKNLVAGHRVLAIFKEFQWFLSSFQWKFFLPKFFPYQYLQYCSYNRSRKTTFYLSFRRLKIRLFLKTLKLQPGPQGKRDHFSKKKFQVRQQIDIPYC